MAKKEKSAIDAMIALNNRKSIKNEERKARLMAEKARVEERIKKVEAEERAKREREINNIYNKISKEIKAKSGILQFLRKEAQYVSAEDFEQMLNRIIESVKAEVEETKKKITEGENDGKEHSKENRERTSENAQGHNGDIQREEQKEEQGSFENGEGAGSGNF